MAQPLLLDLLEGAAPVAAAAAAAAALRQWDDRRLAATRIEPAICFRDVKAFASCRQQRCVYAKLMHEAQSAEHREVGLDTAGLRGQQCKPHSSASTARWTRQRDSPGAQAGGFRDVGIQRQR